MKKIKLTNFRCLQNLELDFSDGDRNIRNRTVFLGENGTGKSNILKAIALITAGSSALGELLGPPDEWIKRGSKSSRIEAVLTTKGSKERTICLKIDKGDRLKDVLFKSRDSLDEIDNALDYSNRNYFVLGYGASRRLNMGSYISKRSQGYFSDFRSNNVASLFNPDSTLNPLTSWAMDLDYRREDAGKKIVRSALSAFLPDVSFYRIDKENRQLMFKTLDGIMPVHLLSDGYQNMVSWMGDLLFRVTESFENFKSPLKARGVLLIDEIDLHIHPVWQRSLLDFIKNKLPNFQLITTTHSPLTAQQLSEGELYYLKREKKKIKLNKFEGSPKKLLLHQLVMSDAFGIETDESLEVEKTKNEYRLLREKKDLSLKEKKRLEELTSYLKELPKISRPNFQLADEQVQLLEQINLELKERKK